MLALEAVHVILDNPGKWVVLDDHFQESQEGDRHLFGLVVDVLRALKVHYQADKHRMSFMSLGPPSPYQYPNISFLEGRQVYLNRAKNRDPSKIFL